jgi:glycosyltransferase involved in cell wall biosynthesis
MTRGELAELGHKITVYMYNSTPVTKIFSSGKVKIKSIGGIASNAKKLGLLYYEDVDTWNVGVWDELEHEDTTELILLFDWFGFDAARAHRKLYQSKIIGLVGVLANGRGGFGPFTDSAKLTDYKEKELTFLKECDQLVAFNQCSYGEVRKFTSTKCSIVNLGVEDYDISRNVSQGNVLVVGRIARDRCLELVLRAVAELNWVSLVICGAGKDTDYGKYLTKLATKIDLNFKIEFVDADPAPYYERAEMVICPSVYDAFGYSVMDAYNSGVPVIGNYTSYHQDIIRPNMGMLFQSVGELVCCMSDLHHSEKLRQQFSHLGKVTVEQHYQYESSVKKLEAVLR